MAAARTPALQKQKRKERFALSPLFVSERFDASKLDRFRA
jgi:hypothetical protein